MPFSFADQPGLDLGYQQHQSPSSMSGYSDIGSVPSEDFRLSAFTGGSCAVEELSQGEPSFIDIMQSTDLLSVCSEASAIPTTIEACAAAAAASLPSFQETYSPR